MMSLVRLWKKKLKLFFQNPGQWLCSVMKSKINQLLRNVLGNALKFSEPKSRIEVNLMADQNSAIIDVIGQWNRYT